MNQNKNTWEQKKKKLAVVKNLRFSEVEFEVDDVNFY